MGRDACLVIMSYNIEIGWTKNKFWYSQYEEYKAYQQMNTLYPPLHQEPEITPIASGIPSSIGYTVSELGTHISKFSMHIITITVATPPYQVIYTSY